MLYKCRRKLVIVKYTCKNTLLIPIFTIFRRFRRKTKRVLDISSHSASAAAASANTSERSPRKMMVTRATKKVVPDQEDPVEVV
jgi:hypothetical protein